jgi:hypothetical protein
LKVSALPAAPSRQLVVELDAVLSKHLTIDVAFGEKTMPIADFIADTDSRS